MAGLAASRRRPFNTRGRSGTTPKKRSSGDALSLEAGVASEPPPKKRRYVPGGPGGGGRYIDADGTETLVFAGQFRKKERQRDRPAPHTAPRPRRSERDLGLGLGLGLGLDGTGDPHTPTLALHRPRRESRREKSTAPRSPRPRYSSAAAATAAMVQGDGFKPREERGWEEFHQDLEIETDLPCFDSDEVDGLTKPTTPGPSNGTIETANGDLVGSMQNGDNTPAYAEEIIITPPPRRRGPGRPPRRPISLLKGIGTPDTPKLVPLPGPNPRERLTLPKPSFRRVNPFELYERTGGSQDYVDKQMASFGYQESELFRQPTPFIRLVETGVEDDIDMPAGMRLDSEGDKSAAATTVKRVEYDMDEQDQKFLEEYNRHRKDEDVEAIKPAIFEVIMSFIEKEWHCLERRIPKPNPKPPQTHRPRSSSAAAVNGEAAGQGEDQDTKCAICDDGDCENTNAIVFCDGCDLAVHQECYGVPFIPEGQWLCRKCRVIGSGVPTCIFCPNMDGAFKQTNSSKWAHLLCAIWIPEVSLGNSTFMEPVMDVEKVPRQRWKLTCTICNQKMGACIQCGNKNCFRAFHVTCARRAKWCLQMKSSHGGPASLDASVLKAFCDKHVPADWAEANDVAGATAETVRYYRHAMRGKVWANTQQMAQSMQAQMHRPEAALPSVEESLPKINLIVKDDKGKKKKPSTPPKSMWRLPSGAPVVPAVIYDSVESLLQRMTIRKRKDFAADMCRYWTLKREARRGAPLIKRLQLQMEMFSSMEITRRDFVAMGAAGGPRLQRRKSFSKMLQKDSDQLKKMSEMVIKKQQAMLEDDHILDTILDTIYYPIAPLLRPMVDKAILLNGKWPFQDRLLQVRERVEARLYVSTYQFAADLAAAFANEINTPPVLPPPSEDSTPFDEPAWRAATVAEQKEKRKLAKRILKVIEPMLKTALQNEADLLKKPIDEMPELNLLDMGLPAKDPPLPSVEDTVVVHPTEPTTHAEQSVDQEEIAAPDSQTQMDIDVVQVNPDVVTLADSEDRKQPSPPSHPTPATSATSNAAEGSFALSGVPEPPTPPLSHASGSSAWNALAYGGVPWYMTAFEPAGTTVYDEKWTGRDVTRDMSEELSDMGDEELDGLRTEGDLDDVEGLVAGTVKVEATGPTLAKAAAKAASLKAAAKKSKAKKRSRR